MVRNGSPHWTQCEPSAGKADLHILVDTRKAKVDKEETAKEKTDSEAVVEAKAKERQRQRQSASWSLEFVGGKP